ncbi:MAG TPA: class I SAM-dependent methyltransferase [Methyloceanibacter sp.]|nr:class I SAM-dependent methyltransferase [Methyloceanibacter sp.]
MNRRESERREVEYILGHSPHELRRLILQAEILRPITERLLKEAGIKLGMRVLDLGCGTGDVAMLAAELVGPKGDVVGIDRSDEAICLARDRASRAGYGNIEFRSGAAEVFADFATFDLAVGRYVLQRALSGQLLPA